MYVLFDQRRSTLIYKHGHHLDRGMRQLPSRASTRSVLARKAIRRRAGDDAAKRLHSIAGKHVCRWHDILTTFPGTLVNAAIPMLCTN